MSLSGWVSDGLVHDLRQKYLTLSTAALLGFARWDVSVFEQVEHQEPGCEWYLAFVFLECSAVILFITHNVSVKERLGQLQSTLIGMHK